MKYMLFTYRDPSVQLEPGQRAAQSERGDALKRAA